MSTNKEKIISLKEKSGKIIIWNGTFGKVLGKGDVDVDIKNTKGINVLFVDWIMDKIICVRKIDDKGHVMVFKSIGCKTEEEDIQKTIAKGFRNLDNLQVLKKNVDINKRYSSYSSNLE